MRDSFRRNLLEEQDKTILFIGGGGKSTLIRRLNEDCFSLKKKTIITSLFSQKLPPEAKTIIAANIPNITRATNRELPKNQNLYLGKTCENNVLTPFTEKEIGAITSDIRLDHLFVEADSSSGKSLSSLKKVPALKSLQIDRYILVIGADIINKTYSKNSTNSSDPFWRLNPILSPLNITNFYSQNLVLQRLFERAIPVACFINKVENTYTENLALILAKELKKVGFDKVITGSVFESALQIIK